MKAVSKKTQGKNVPINSKLRPFNSNVKGENSAGK